MNIAGEISVQVTVSNASLNLACNFELFLLVYVLIS